MLTMLTRRQFSKQLLTGGTILLASDSPLSLADSNQSSNQIPSQASRQGPDQTCDLLIKGGTVLDPGQRLQARMDVAVKGGKILEVSPDIPESRALAVYSAKDKIVTPGFIDLH